jgi:hypothetical protein
MPAHETKFILRDKAERFIAELYLVLRRYPKSERHVLAAETRQTAYRFLRNVIVAGKTGEKKANLERADTELALLGAMLRIGKQLEYLQFTAYERLARLTDELGRILGGWIKKTT